MRAQLTVASIVRQLGGAKSVADALGIGRSAISMWKRNGYIPVKQAPRLRRIARAKGVVLTIEQITDAIEPQPIEAEAAD